MSDVVAFLATVPLLEGIPAGRAGRTSPALLRRRDVPAGHVLWRQGEEALAMLLIVDGRRVGLAARCPATAGRGRAALGRGEVLGEIPLLDGGRHSADGARDRAGDRCSR